MPVALERNFAVAWFGEELARYTTRPGWAFSFRTQLFSSVKKKKLYHKISNQVEMLGTVESFTQINNKHHPVLAAKGN